MITARTMYNVSTWFGEYEVFLVSSSYYGNKNLAIEMVEPEEGPFARLTVNLGRVLPKDMAFVDTNNCPWAVNFIEENELGEFTGEFGYSGFCSYPLYKFYLERIES